MATATDAPRVLTASQLAHRWQVNVKMIHRHVRAGRFPLKPILPDARALRFSLEAVERHERSTASAA